MTLQQFSQALLTEHLLIVSCQAYQKPEKLLELIQSLENPGQKLCLALPFAALEQNFSLLSSLNIRKGLSDIYNLDPNTFAGSIALRMAKEARIDFAVVGGTLSRDVYYESDQAIALKIRGLLEAGITPVVCFGETLQDYLRGTSKEVIQEQLGNLLLGLSFDQLVQIILVYKSPWNNYIAPEHFAEESQISSTMVLVIMQHLFGQDAASHIPLLTNLPNATDDYRRVSYDIPPSGFFLEFGGQNPELVADYFHLLKHEPVPFHPLLTPTPPLAPTKAAEDTKLEKKGKKSKKKKEESIVEAPVESETESIIESLSETVEDSLHESILSIEKELAEPSLHFELHEETLVNDEAPELSMEDREESAFDWFSDEELEALQKEFGITPDGRLQPRPPPSWDSSHQVRIIPTQAQKKEKPKKKKSK